jgi:hypothetical protein
MQFIVADRSVKVLAAAIAFLAKIGREIVFEGTVDGVVLRTLNDARSSFATVVLKRGERLSAQGRLCQTRQRNEHISRLLFTPAAHAGSFAVADFFESFSEPEGVSHKCRVLSKVCAAGSKKAVTGAAAAEFPSARISVVKITSGDRPGLR